MVFSQLRDVATRAAFRGALPDRAPTESLFGGVSPARRSQFEAMAGGARRLAAAAETAAATHPAHEAAALGRRLSGASAVATTAFASMLDKYDAMLGPTAEAPDPAALTARSEREPAACGARDGSGGLQRSALSQGSKLSELDRKTYRGRTPAF